MNNEFIETLTFRKLIELILEAKSKIIFSSANLHLEVATSLSEAAKNGVDTIIIIDPSV